MFVENNFVLSTTHFSVRGNDDTDGLLKENSTNSGINLCTGSKYKHTKKWAVAVCNDNLPRHAVQVEFDYFDMENADDCIFGSLKLLAGDREETSFLNEQSCGKNKHGQTFVTMGKSLSLEIKTDESLALKNFQAKVSFVPDTECICKDNMECTRDNTEKCIHGKYCDINTCQNGGTCIQTSFEEKCYCPKGFKGDDCSQRYGEFSNKITFISAPVDRTLKRGQGHIEECLVEVPYEEEVVYSWSLQGTLINPYNNTIGFGTHPGGILQIDKFSDEMEGQYSCIATTSVETVNHTFTYTIAEDCDVRIYPGPQSEIKKPNEIALLTCRVNHRVKEVRWKKDGVYIDFNKDDRIKVRFQMHIHVNHENN
ncbi:uncharacterized protein LOC132723399 [Ruditapes philippinarum]|uniref:uncharacterized protein LOC132723399 n=1 Tax=Ruditapes philippinarum TaxID=129788 RepID=UPI00295B7D56|nr:uncharacterized protein LOC132723399 [Ruditapes philippinarum]